MVALGAAALAGTSLLPPHPGFRPRDLPPGVRDRALACLAMGTLRPEIAELTDRELEDVVEILGRLIDGYENREFDSFLALRAGDLDAANRTEIGRLGELRGFCAALGVDSARPSDWRGALEAYWHAYYREGPAALFEPEASDVELHREQALGSFEAWEAGFDALVGARPGARLDHHPSVPHRRSAARLANEAGELRWLDVQLAFRASDGAGGRLITRFVWDAPEQEWFLHRATTIHDEGSREDRLHLVL
jgi:hypothetical protein